MVAITGADSQPDISGAAGGVCGEAVTERLASGGSTGTGGSGGWIIAGKAAGTDPSGTGESISGAAGIVFADTCFDCSKRFG
jgi:hypothetical protein